MNGCISHFCIYLPKKSPCKMQEILHYMSIISEAVAHSFSLSWRTSDEQFRVRQPSNVQSWAKLNIDKYSWKNGSLRNRENLQYKKTADSVLLSLFMRTNRKCNNSHAPSTGLSGILLSARTQYSWRAKIWKYTNICTISLAECHNCKRVYITTGTITLVKGPLSGF